MTTTLTLCAICKHRHPAPPGRWAEYTCEAYPHGIPDRFLSGEAAHTSRARRDGGIQFEPAEGVTQEALADILDLMGAR